MIVYLVLMSAHNSQPIPILVKYFATSEELPIITQEFTPGKGWKITGFNKHVTRSWLRKLRAQGITHVSLALNGRTPDFSIAELLKVDRHPLLTGNLIGAAVKIS